MPNTFPQSASLQLSDLFLGINSHKLCDLFPFLKGLAFTYKRIITKRQGKEGKKQGHIHKKGGRGKVLLISNDGAEATPLLVLILSIQFRSSSST